MTSSKIVKFVGDKPATIRQWRAGVGDVLSRGSVLFSYTTCDEEDEASGQRGEANGPLLKFRCDRPGTLQEILITAGARAAPHCALAVVGACTHPTVMKDLCAECGADLRQQDSCPTSAAATAASDAEGPASVAMLHSIPELRVSRSEAEQLGRRDMELLLRNRKLVLLVDLDQTLVHTTNDDIPPRIKDVFHFQLYGPRSQWYHTRLRPGTRRFLAKVSRFYELHVCTFGTRLYAHTVTALLDPQGTYFSQRILSRDECFSAHSKTANLKSLFPCGEHMVCIIDDRQDVWNFVPNLVQVKPYHFFKHTGDINAPPGLEKAENDDKEGIDFDRLTGGTSGAADPVTADAATSVPAANSGELERRDSMPNLSDDEEDVGVGRLDDVGAATDTAEKPAAREIIDELNADLSLSEDEADGEAKSGAESTHPTQTANEAPSPADKTETDQGKKQMPSKTTTTTMTEQRDSVKVGQEPSTVTNKSGSAENNSDELDVADTDDYLMYLEDILVKIHRVFYTMHDNHIQQQQKNNSESVGAPEPDLRVVVPYVRKKVLNGVRLIFSGVVPSNTPLSHSLPYRIASGMGAHVQEHIVRPPATSSGAATPQDNSTTHVVAARLGTAKTNEALRCRRVRIVSADWLWCCAERWQWVDERLFPLTVNTTASRLPPLHCASPPSLTGPCDTDAADHVRDHNDVIRAGDNFQETLNPLLAFSPDDIARMDEEVEDILQSDSADEDDEGCLHRDHPISSSDPSLCHLSAGQHQGAARTLARKRPAPVDSEDEGQDSCDGDMASDDDDDEEFPHVRFRRGEPLASDEDIGGDGNNNSDDDEEQDHSPDLEEDWSMMGAELERELGSSDD